ncbi:hypothetical protein HII31_07732, partial [Pseudocercospora fuligena]
MLHYDHREHPAQEHFQTYSRRKGTLVQSSQVRLSDGHCKYIHKPRLKLRQKHLKRFHY